MKKILAIVIMGLFFIGCGGEDNSIQSDENIKLPTVSSSFEKSMYRIFKALDGKGKNEEDSTTDNNSDENSNDVSTEVDTNAPTQNRDIVSEPFDTIEDMFTTQYSAFPANSTHQKTENSIKKVIVDDNGIVHMIISQIAWWIGVKSNGNSENGMSRHFQYYYMSYNPTTKQKSTPKKIFEAKILNDGNLPDERFIDFIMIGNTPIVIAINYKNYTIKKYQLDRSPKIIDTKNNNKYIDSFKLVNYNEKIYLIYRNLPDRDIIKDFRLKRVEIYPNIGVVNNIIDEYISSSTRVHSNSIFFYTKGIFFNLDNNMKIIETSKEEIGESISYLKGQVNIYDSTVKELLLDNDKNVILLNQDNSEEVLFNINDSFDMNNFTYNFMRGVASVYKDKIIIAYRYKDEKQYKVVIFDRYTKDTKSVLSGSNIYANDNKLFKHIYINKNKRVVVGNIDGKYDYSAQLTVADIPSSKSKKEKILTETNNLSFGYYKDKNRERWYISLIDAFKAKTVYSLMPIKNGNAGWGVVGKNIAKFDLDADTITIDDIPNNGDGKYSVRYGSSTEIITSDRVQSDIEKIRNSTVDITWWFFTVAEGSWYIINKGGDVYHFSSKEVVDNGVKSEEYDWQKVDLGGAVPTFFVEDGVKKFRF